MNKRELIDFFIWQSSNLHRFNELVEPEDIVDEFEKYINSLHPSETTKVGTNKQSKEYYNGDWCNYTKGNCASPSMDACKTCHCYKL